MDETETKVELSFPHRSMPNTKHTKYGQAITASVTLH